MPFIHYVQQQRRGRPTVSTKPSRPSSSVISLSGVGALGEAIRTHDSLVVVVAPPSEEGTNDAAGGGAGRRRPEPRAGPPRVGQASSRTRMTGIARRLKGPCAAGLALVAGVLGLGSVFVASARSALAESATSLNGTVTISVPPIVLAGGASTYTLTFTNTSTSTTTNVVAVGSLPTGMTLKSIGNCARLGGNQSTSFNCTMPNLAPGASESATFSILASAAGSYELPVGVAAAIPDSASLGASGTRPS